jgi:putative NIF3 family GTP cyclohydrolase 1 type 2
MAYSAHQAQAAAPRHANPFPLHAGPITALQCIDHIRANSGWPAKADMADYVVAGDPTTAVTGIATTAIASLDCLKAAVAAKLNLVISLEPVFWSTGDNLDRIEGNALFHQKRDYIRSNGLVVYRLHDDWPAKGPSGIATGMARALGWESYIADPANPASFKLPATTLLDLAKDLSQKLNDRTLRIVGDPALPVSRVGAIWGRSTQMPAIRLVNEPIDVALLGYSFEWEIVEYVQDMVSTGESKGLILLGETRSEEAGMKYCAEWLKTLLPDIRVDYIPGIEPYWSPQHPRVRG